MLCRNYSEAKAINRLLNSYYITGFADGESSFTIVPFVRIVYLKQGEVSSLDFG